MASNNSLILSPENPYRNEVNQFRKAMKNGSRTHQMDDGYKHTKITVIEQTEYFPGSFAKLYQNKELLSDLTPDECKIIIEMSMMMGYNDEKVNLTPETVHLEKRRFHRAMAALQGRNLLKKEKPHWYWVNVTVLIVGHLSKDKQIEDI